MLPQFDTASVGPICDYAMPKSKAIAGSFYANKFCLLYIDAPLQRALWRAATSRRAIEACKAAIVAIEITAGQVGWHCSVTALASLVSELNKLESK
jgi:hypothetical protein